MKSTAHTATSAGITVQTIALTAKADRIAGKPSALTEKSEGIAVKVDWSHREIGRYRGDTTCSNCEVEP